MEDFYINNTSLDKGYNYSNTTSDYYNYSSTTSDYYNYSSTTSNYFHHNYEKLEFITHVVTYIITCIGLPLTLVAIYGLCSLVRNDHVGPIYIINLLISDLIQLCFMSTAEAKPVGWNISIIYFYGVIASVGFMVCVALERYLVIACPLWYRFRQTIKVSVMVCVVVWALPFVYFLPVYFWVDFQIRKTIYAVFLLFPFPLLIFFLGGTLKALSGSISVPSDDKRRIVGLLVLVLLIYTLLFLPRIILLLADRARINHTFRNLSFMFLKLSPFADLALYVFMRKGTIDKLSACVLLQSGQQ